MRVFLLIIALLPSLSLADATVPTKDIPGARDLPNLKRYQGSFIIDHIQSSFDTFSLPTGSLKNTDKIDKNNNSVALPTQKIDAEGKLDRYIYVTPANRSPLEVIRNYEEELSANGGKVLFRCKEEECGGDVNTGADGGGGTTGMVNLLYPRDYMKQTYYSNGGCALFSTHAKQNYSAIQVTRPDGTELLLALLAYSLNDDLYCKALNDRTVLLMTAVEIKPREQRMVSLLPANELSNAIGSKGHVAIYGIYFDTGKAEVKPNSYTQISEMAKMLKANSKLNVIVAGHTDNQGELGYNMELSKRRAEAVVQALVKEGIAASRMTAQGVGMAAPLASNDDEEGRSKNRRVEVVKR